MKNKCMTKQQFKYYHIMLIRVQHWYVIQWILHINSFKKQGISKKTLNKEKTAKHLVLHFNDFHHTLINLASLSSNHFLSLLRIRVEEACIYFTVQTIISLWLVQVWHVDMFLMGPSPGTHTAVTVDHHFTSFLLLIFAIDTWLSKMLRSMYLQITD